MRGACNHGNNGHSNNSNNDNNSSSSTYNSNNDSSNNSSNSNISKRDVASDGMKWYSVRPISLLSLSLLRLLDSNLPGDSLWAWEFHPLRLRVCLSQNL